MENASPGDAIENRAAQLESARNAEAPADVAPAHEPRHDVTAHEPRHEPVATPVLSQVEFHAVSEHDQVESADEAHRPSRRRKGEHASAEKQPLQMVETQAPVQMAPDAEHDLPRRTKPRRRRGGQAAPEPLQLVETTHEEPRQDNPAQ